ncbi:hypothetical protein CDAR_243301 [Caerostris darwini]|uniref:Uncharacterized protein n=1 Tax=Caerostris darwini TaxID=1538125 RepID=A0AAV4MLV9_9ARAC|nr:hypothetical protein CDAR_243301 [Caerostris darwini]
MDRRTYHCSESKRNSSQSNSTKFTTNSQPLVFNLPISYKARTPYHGNGFNCIHIPLAPLNRNLHLSLSRIVFLRGRKVSPSPGLPKINLFGET